MVKKSLKIIFYSSQFTGPQNSCIGLAQTLKERGHDCYFFSETKFLNKFQKFNFKCLELKQEDDNEELIDKNSNKNENENKIDKTHKYMEQLLETKFLENGTPLQKLRQLNKMNFLENDFGSIAEKYHEQIKQYLSNKMKKFDLIIIDSEIYPPILTAINRPWIYVFCSNPIGLFQSDKLPPFTSDFATDSNPDTWKEFQMELDHFYQTVRNGQKKLFEKFGINYNDNGNRFVRLSPYLNLYQYPKEIDYNDYIDIDSKKFFGVDAFCRFELNSDNGDNLFEIPFRNKMKKNDKLIYVSLGSMGSCNLELMKRLILILSKTKHWYIISKGLLHKQLPIIAENLYGEQYVPQTYILSMVDAAILHGGNNGFTEALYFGRPTIIMPMFYDQYHNGQRVKEKKIGLKLDPYNFTDDELIESIDHILFDEDLRRRCDEIGKNIRKRQSKHQACELLETIVENFDKK